MTLEALAVPSSLPLRYEVFSKASRLREDLPTIVTTCHTRLALQAPWWSALDLRVLRHVRGVLRRRDLELTLVVRRPDEPAAFAAISADDADGAGLAVFAPQLSAPELGLIELMLREAALDVATALRDRRPPAEPPAELRTGYHGIIGSSPAMQELYQLLDRIAPSDATVLVQGENGTGKELVARAIHVGSDRRDR